MYHTNYYKPDSFDCQFDSTMYSVTDQVIVPLHL